MSIANYFTPSIAKRFLVQCKVINNTTTEDVAINTLISLDEKFRFNKAFMYLTDKGVKEVNNYLLKCIEESENGGGLLHLGLISVALRSQKELGNFKELKEIKKIKSKIKKEENPEEVRSLPIISFDKLQDYEDKTYYYIKKMFAGSSVNMVYSPPAQSKSIICLYAAICIASGTNFMNIKTSKAGVLYIDKENNTDVIKQRAMALCKGQKINMKNLNLHFLVREGSLDIDFRLMLEEFIEENDIKVIFLDTIRRFGNFDENSSNDINEIYQEFFIPLMEEYGICFIFLHHTTKQGKYRGSGDLEAQVNVAYEITKSQKKDSPFKIRAAKTRGNEVEELSGNISFNNIEIDEDTEFLDSILIETQENVDNSKTISYTTVKQYFDRELSIERYYKFTELLRMCSDDGICKRTKLAQYLKWSVDKGIMGKDHNEKCYRVLEKKDNKIMSESIRKYIIDGLEQFDMVILDNLNQMYNRHIVMDVVQDLIKEKLVYEHGKGALKKQ